MRLRNRGKTQSARMRTRLPRVMPLKASLVSFASTPLTTADASAMRPSKGRKIAWTPARTKKKTARITATRTSLRR
jgi:hypothetical protein